MLGLLARFTNIVERHVDSGVASLLFERRIDLDLPPP
jgi:hypothetical protein